MVKSKKKRKGDFISFLIGVISVCAFAVLLFCASQLVSKMVEYRESDEAFSEIKNSMVVSYDPALRLEDQADGAIDTIEVHTIDITEGMHPEVLSVIPDDALKIDWDAYSGTEIVAWFQMDDISYPIMQHSDNDYYLHRLPDGTYNFGGSLFLLNHNNPMFTDQSSFVYGHNMNNGSMFGSLRHCITPDWKGHKFYIYLPDGTRHVYRFFSVATVFQESKAYTYSFESSRSFLDWQQWLLDQSMFDTGESVTANARFVTLSTCNGLSGTNHRLVICGIEERIEQLQLPAVWYDTYLRQYNDRNAAKALKATAILSDLEAIQASKRDALWSAYMGFDDS